MACGLASAADARPQATFQGPYKASTEHPPPMGLHKEGCEKQAAIRHLPRKEVVFLCVFVARCYHVFPRFLCVFSLGPNRFCSSRPTKKTQCSCSSRFYRGIPVYFSYVFSSGPRFPISSSEIVSRSVFMELERRAPGETLTWASPFRFCEHGP